MRRFYDEVYVHVVAATYAFFFSFYFAIFWLLLITADAMRRCARAMRERRGARTRLRAA